MSNNAELIVNAFLAEMIPLSQIHNYICYSAQYARTLTLEQAIMNVELFDIHGRWFVSRAFVERINRPIPLE